MALTMEERTLEAQQDITPKNAKEDNIGAPKLGIDPNVCPGCRRIRLACKCSGGGGASESDNASEKMQDETQGKTNSQRNFQRSPFNLVLIPREKKAAKEHLENSELYEIQDGNTPQDVLAFFNAHLNRLALTQNRTLTDLDREDFSGKIENGIVLLTFPNEKERERFRQIAVSPDIGLIKPTLLNPNNSNSVGQQMLVRITSPQNSRD